MSEDSPESSKPAPEEPEEPAPGEPEEPSPEEPVASSLSPPEPPVFYPSSRDVPKTRQGNLPAYQVAARMLFQGVLSGFAGAVPLTFFILVAMALDGVNPGPEAFLAFVAAYFSFAAMIAAWGAALTAVEEFARRADRSLRRMVVVSLGFPLFATVATAWIGGLINERSPMGGLRMVRMLLKDFWREFQREPFASLAITGALLIPFLGLLLLRRRVREEEGDLLVSRYYLSSAGLGLASATCVLVANLSWGTRIEGGPLLRGFTALGTLLMAIAWGLARGRAISDHYSRRYERWANAD